VGLDGNNNAHSGNSMVVGPLGEVLYHRADEDDIFHIRLQKEEVKNTRDRFPFWKDADDFSIL
jgi:predicted amidohydrolase